MTLDLIALVGALIAIATVGIFAVVLQSPPAPSSARVRDAVLAAMPEELPAGAIYELGSGWGGLAWRLAARYPDREVVGIELSPLPWLFSRLRQWVGRKPNLRYRLANLHKIPFTGAGTVVCYLQGGTMARLGSKLAVELAPGSLVVAITFALPGWAPEALIRAEDMYRSPVYFYRIGNAVGPQAGTTLH
jgi:hypothetical protein